MRRRIVKTMVLLVLALAVPARALAALGADASSVARDQEALKGALTVTPAVGYEIHELKISSGVVAACGGGGNGGGAAPLNVVAATVDSGPAAAPGSVDILFVSVTICAPGTAICQTIDHVQVDTGSTGFRVLGEVLGAGVTSGQLQQATDASGNPLVECMQFADGYSWGPIKLVDLTIGGMKPASGPTQGRGAHTDLPRPI